MESIYGQIRNRNTKDDVRASYTYLSSKKQSKFGNSRCGIYEVPNAVGFYHGTTILDKKKVLFCFVNILFVANIYSVVYDADEETFHSGFTKPEVSTH